MRATIDHETLLSGLNAVCGSAAATESTPSMPILSHVLVSVAGETVTFGCTDTKRAAVARRKASGTEEGAVAVPVVLLRKIVRSMPAGVPIVVEGEPNNYMALRAEWRDATGGHKVAFRLVGKPAIDFPRLPSAVDACSPVDARALRECIDGVLPAVSTDATRPHLCGVYLESDGSTIRATASDGHRALRVSRSATCAAWEGKILVPRDGAKELLAVLKADRVALAVADGYLNLRVGDDSDVAAVKLSEACDPVGFWTIVQGHLGASPDSTATVDRKELLAAVKALGKLCGMDEGVVIGASPAGMRVAVAEKARGAGRRELAATLDGSPAACCVSARYLSETLARLDGDTVTIGLRAKVDDPIQVRDASGDTAIIMPIRDGNLSDAWPTEQVHGEAKVEPKVKRKARAVPVHAPVTPANVVTLPVAAPASVTPAPHRKPATVTPIRPKRVAATAPAPAKPGELPALESLPRYERIAVDGLPKGARQVGPASELPFGVVTHFRDRTGREWVQVAERGRVQTTEMRRVAS